MNSFERIFTSRFLSYEKEGHPLIARSKKNKQMETIAQKNSLS